MKSVAMLAVLVGCSPDAGLRGYHAPRREPMANAVERDPRLAAIVELQRRTFAAQLAGAGRALEAIAGSVPADRAARFRDWQYRADLPLQAWQTRTLMEFDLVNHRLAESPADIAAWVSAWTDRAATAERLAYDHVLTLWMRETGGWIDIALVCSPEPCAVGGLDVHAEPPIAAAIRASAQRPIALAVRRRIGVRRPGTGAGTAWAEPVFELAPDGEVTIAPGAPRWPGIGTADAGLAASGLAGLLRAAPAAVRSP